MADYLEMRYFLRLASKSFCLLFLRVLGMARVLLHSHHASIQQFLGFFSPSQEE
jgi:hypothetical protein